MKVAIVDFETNEILPRPHYPPEPVGVSIILPGEKKARYYGWGHTDAPAKERADGMRALKKIWDDPTIEVVCHNAKFDLAVAWERLGLKMLPWHRIHCTMILAFLNDPYSSKLNLKQLAVRYLGAPPNERDEMIDWMRENIPEVRRAPTQWFKYMARLPLAVAARYADGDTYRTAALFKKFYAYVKKMKMTGAYDRERRLMPHLMDMEKRGVPVHERALRTDVKRYGQALEMVDASVRKRLKAPSLDLNRSEELANALERNDLVISWTLTEKGRRSTAADALKTSLKDQKLVATLDYRAILSTALNTFMKPWAETADASGCSRIYTNWNQVRQDYHSSGGKGTKTGRLSSNPNFQNIISVENAEKFQQVKHLIELLKSLNLNTLVPNVRGYIAPPAKNGVLIGRDYSQQEFRLLGHYEDGPLKEAYLANPRMDVHETARVMINEMLKREFTRKPIKNTGFGLIYGMGAALLAEKSSVDMATAKLLRKTYLDAFPGMGELIDELQARADNDEPIRTWGGRVYYCEPPFVDKFGRTRTLEYRLINTLIQGSAADVTKEAMIRYVESKGYQRHGDELFLTVHDELLAGVTDARRTNEALEVMRVAMESIECDVMMLSDGKYSRKSWGEMIEVAHG
mgnify:CR=1 FL=1